MFKKMIKICLAGLLFSTKFKKKGRPVSEGRDAVNSCLILMYHRVHPLDRTDKKMPEWLKIKSLPGIVVSPEMFAKQIHFIKEYYRVIALDTLVKYINEGKGIPANSAVITFDDGWRDNYDYAYPILKQHTIPATIFLSTGYINTNRLFWPEMLIYSLTYHSERCKNNLQNINMQGKTTIYDLFNRIFSTTDKINHPLFNHLIEQMKQVRPDERKKMVDAVTAGVKLDSDEMRVMMNWEEVMEMSKAGINFGSHGVEHEILTLLNHNEIHKELDDSKQTIANKLSTKEIAFAYPNGNHDDNIKKAVNDNGYICAVSTKTGIVDSTSDRFALERINIHQDNSSGLGGRFSKALFAYHIDLRFK